MFNELENAINIAVSDPAERGNQFSDLSAFASLIVNIMIGAAFGITTIGLAYAFIQFIMSHGDPKAIEKARNAALWSAIAITITIMAVVIKNVIFRAAGVTANNLLNEDPGF